MTYLKCPKALGTAICGALLFCSDRAITQEFRLSPELGFEGTVFPDSPAFDGQFDSAAGAIIASGELSWRSADRNVQAVFEPYLRYDSRDDDRTYGDIRRGFFRYFGDGWDLTIGADRVFWGVVESVNVVDVINQRDRLESIDLDEKLGQPMVRFSTFSDIGNFDVFYLPYFREREYPSLDSRLRLPFVVDENAAAYQREGEETAGDFALRYSNTFGGFDLGINYFYGTAREPRLDFNAATNEFEPFYQRQRQVSLDVQYTSDAWLWKLEAAQNEIGSDSFLSAVGGVEYTFFDVHGSGRDLGLIAEYLHDGRDQTLSPLTPFDDDVFLGTRVTWNDVEDTEFLMGAIVDVNNGGLQFSAEFQRRIWDNNLLEIEARAFDASGDPLLEPFEEDTSILVRWTRFF